MTGLSCTNICRWEAVPVGLN